MKYNLVFQHSEISSNNFLQVESLEDNYIMKDPLKITAQKLCPLK